MDDAGDYRYTRRRRAITVAVSVAATVALCVGYAVADMCDAAPGVLTLRHVEHSTAAAAGRSIEAADVIADIDVSKTIDPAAARALTDAFRASAAGFGGEFSIAIADASGNVAAENNIDVPRTPASTMKNVDGVCGRRRTRHGQDPGHADLSGTVPGRHRALVLKGNGDMLLGAGASDANHINGRAGLGTLAGRTAQALRQRGITSVTLAYDDTLFGNDRWPQGIAELDTDHLYYAPTASMAVDSGRNWNGTGPANPDVFSAYPALSMQPARDAALVFQQRLAEQGITVQGFVSQGTVAGASHPLASVRSASLNEIMAFTMRHSDNSLAEEFGRLLALQVGADNSPAGAVQAVKSVLERKGITTTGLDMRNCSGLTEDSKLTARTLLEVQLRNLAAGSGAAAAEGMSVMGFVGTAESRLNDADEAGLIRVKTGSLGDVTSMTGNVSRLNGGALTFAVIVNNPTDFAAAKAAIDTFVAGLPKL